MKIITVTETCTREVYKFEASDGTVFETEADCRFYETQLERKILEGIETCEELEDHPPFTGEDFSEYHYYHWYRPKSEEEIDKLKEAFPDADFESLNPGQWVCIETDCSDSFGWAYPLEDSIAYARSILDKLGYEMILGLKNNQ